ncbi:uncharacterized protein [Haliotis cracherodii]|uniref:uncharacterized protein n=1 Tax=Haliotis cracherodii TaxID=6455 RepID=UPI0039E9A622
MDDLSYKLQVFHTVNEYKAHRLNRTEQCKLESARTLIHREKTLYEKDFQLRVQKLKTRQQEMKRDVDVGSDDERKEFKTLPDSARPSSLRFRGCKSARLPKSEECSLCDRITDIVLKYEAEKRPKNTARYATSTNLCQSDSHVRQFLESIETTVMPLKWDVTSGSFMDAGRIHLDGRAKSCKDGMLSMKTDKNTDINPSQKRLIRESTKMLPPDDMGHVCTTLTSAKSRRTFPAKIEIQRKVGEFVQSQEVYNRTNPVNEDIVVQCEAFRLHSGNRVDRKPPQFVSRREAMMSEVLEKLGITKAN